MFFSSESLLFCFAFFLHALHILSLFCRSRNTAVPGRLACYYFCCFSLPFGQTSRVRLHFRGPWYLRHEKPSSLFIECRMHSAWHTRPCVYANGVRMVCFRLAVFLILPLPNGDPLPLPCHGVCLSLRLDFNAKGREGVRVDGKTPVSPAFLGSCVPVLCCVETLKGFVLFYHFVLGFQKQFHLSAGKNMISFYFLSLKRNLVVLF